MIDKTERIVPNTPDIDYRDLAEALPSMVALSSSDGALLYVNRRWRDYTGFSLRELDEDRSRFVHPEDLERVTQASTQARSAEEPLEVEYRVRRHDGTYRWHLWRAVPLRDAHGRVFRWLGTTTDIHEGRRAEERAAHHEGLYSTLANSLPAIVTTADADGNITYFNERWFTYTGLTPETSTLEGIRSVVHPEEREAVVQLWRNAIEHGEPYTIEYRLRRADGVYRWHYGQVVPLGDDAGKIRTWLSASIDIDDRKRAEERLHESQESFRRVVETAAEGVWVLDAETRTTYVNGRMASMLGYQPEEMVGRMLFDFADEEGGRLLRENLARRRAGLHDQYDFRFKHRDGRDVWTIVNAAPLQDAQGNFAASFAMITDVTERRREHDALERSEARYRSLAEHTPALITLSNAEGEIMFCNQRLLEYSGLTMEQVFGGAWRDLLHPNDMAVHGDEWAREIAARRALEGEVRVRRYDGTYRWHFGRLAPVFDDQGGVTMWIGAHVDIDDRKRLELTRELLSEVGEALNATLDYEETLASVVRCLVPKFADFAAVYTLAEDGTINRTASSSANAELITQYNINPAGSRGVPRVLRTGQSELYESVDDDLLAEVATSEEHLQALRATGFTSSIIVPVPSRSGLLGAISLSTTTSGRRYGRQELTLSQEIARRAGLAIENARLFQDAQVTLEELRRANAAKDEFLGLVSHELKTPITTIFGNAEVLRRRGGNLDAETLSTALDDMGREAERLHRIVDNLLVLARLERGNHIAAEPILLRRVAERLIEEHLQRFPMRRIELNATAPLTPVAGEEIYVEQVLRNLISNAEKYSPWDRRIEIAISRDGNELLCSVLDLGAGFSEDEAEKIFTPFYRSPRTSASVSGVGIGLAVCKRLIEVQNGRVWARSRPEGGADIGFALPIVPMEGDRAAFA